MAKIVKPDQLQVKIGITVLVYGTPGIGKTTLALSTNKSVLIDFDGGVGRVRPEYIKDTLQIKSYQDFLDVIEDKTIDSYNTVVIDTVGKMLDYMSDWLIATQPKNGQSNGQLTLQGYGVRKAEFNKILKLMTQKGKNVIFIAHETENKEGDITKIRPHVGGSSGSDLYKELDLIGYMETIGNVRTISFNPSDRYYAKNSCELPSPMTIKMLEQGDQNNFFENEVIQKYLEKAEGRIKLQKAYNEVLKKFDEELEKVKDVDTANQFLEFAKAFPADSHVWASKVLVTEKATRKMVELGIIFNKNEGKYQSKV